MHSRDFFHEGMLEFQDRFDGRRIAHALETHRKHYEFWDDEVALIEASPFFFIASAWKDHVECSVKSGDPGFVRVVAPGTIEYPEYDGNSMYRTLGNISRNPNVGLLFVRFDGESRRIRVNGQATIIEEKSVLDDYWGAKFVVRVACEIHPNCPRYLPDLEKGMPSKFVPRKGEGDPPPPDWKMRDYAQPHLPANDPHRAAIRSVEAKDQMP
jgi:hypothetical protein